MALVTSLLSLLLDPWHEFKRNNYFNNSWHVTRSLLLMLSGGALAFFMVRIELEQKDWEEDTFTCFSCIILSTLDLSFMVPKRINLFPLLQVLTEFVLVSVTSAANVQIEGVVKEAVTILVKLFCGS